MKSCLFVVLFMFTVSLSNLFAQTEKPFIGGGGVLNGKATNLVKPVYPPAAKAVGAEGTVNVQVTIDEDGNVISARAFTGHTLLRKNSEEAALSSKFSPTTLSGKPVKVTGVLVYNFVVGKADTPSIGNENKVYGNVLNGKALSLPKPKYPAAGKAVRAEGAVVVEIIVNESGKVVSAKAVSGHALLLNNCEKAALKARFAPTLIDGKSVKIKGVLVYTFTTQ